MSDNYEPEFGSDNGNDWSDDDDNENNDVYHDAQNSNQISETNHNPTPNMILDTSKRVSQVPVIPARSHAISSVKISIV